MLVSSAFASSILRGNRGHVRVGSIIGRCRPWGQVRKAANIGPMPQLCGLLARPASIQNIEHRAVGDRAVGDGAVETSGNVTGSQQKGLGTKDLCRPAELRKR